MAIPVANPPPDELPPPGAGGQDFPLGDAAPESRPLMAGGLSPVVRGCLVASAFGLFLVCVGGSVLAYSCMGVVTAGSAQVLRNITDGYRGAAVRAGEESTYDADLRRLVALSDEGHLSFITFGILNNRYEDARRDGTVDAEELHHGMELIHDIVIGNGSVDVNRYPQAR